MQFRITILGPVLVLIGGHAVQAQNATYNPPASDVGQLSSPGMVGRSDPMQYLGRVGGSRTGRLDPYNSVPRTAGGLIGGTPNRGFSPMGRPNGMLNPAAGVPSYGGAPNRIHSSQEFRQRGFNARSSYDLNRGQTYATRHQLTRGLIGTPAVRDTGVLASYQAILSSRNQFRTPIERLHSRANLLQPKSPLGQIVTIPELAIYDAAVVKPSDPIAPQADSISVMPEEEGASLRDFDNAMAERLRRRYDEYSVQGLAYFKQKNYIRARDCFDICRGLDRKNPWPYAMDTFVAMETQEFSRAANSLVGAVTRARSLEDLKLDVKLIYGDELDFEKTLNSASNLASADAKDETGKRIKAGQLLLAYCAWHNNDLPTAVSAAQAAARSFPGDAGEGAQRFADLLKAEASGKKSDPEQDETPK